MTRLTAHLIRGAIAAVLIAWAVPHSQTQPALAVTAGLVAVFAMRGCPVCWMLWLCLTISERTKIRGSAPSDRCRAGAGIEPTRPLQDPGF